MTTPSIWLFYLPTPYGERAFASMRDPAFCDLLIELFRAAGAVRRCALFVPGVGI